MTVEQGRFPILRLNLKSALLWSAIVTCAHLPATSSPAAEEPPAESTEVVLRLGNESNKPDGLFGPVTYGLFGKHSFKNGIALEAGFVRLHEPGTATISSFVDEAQFTLKAPEYQFGGQPVIIAATAWKNRMIDMFTNVGGIELTRPGALAMTAGFYLGSATREDESGHFVGGQAGVSGTLGPLEATATYMIGRIDSGLYKRAAIELATTFFKSGNLPLAITLAVEDRYFNFGANRSTSDTIDEVIVISGLEIHFEALFNSNKGN